MPSRSSRLGGSIAFFTPSPVLPLLYHSHMPILVILANFFSAAVMIAILTSSGARVRRWLRLPTGPSDRWATDLVIGAGLCSLWILTLGLIGLLQTAPIVAGLAAQAAIGRWRGNRRPVRPLVIAAVAGLPSLIIAAGPPHFYDAMVYHLGLPWQALLEGGWTAHPENLFSAFPPLAQMTAVPALALDLFRVPGLLHWWAWVCAAVAAGGLARRLGGSRSIGHLVTAAAMLLPVTPLVPGFPAAEGWFLAALVPAAGAALTQRHRQSSLVVMLLLLGLATATRVQGLTWLAILLGLRMFTSRSPVFLLRGMALLLLGSSPWWLKNLILLGDPLAPVFWVREGIETLWRDGGTLMRMGLSPTNLVERLPNLLSRLTLAPLPTLAAAGLAAVSVRKSRPAFAAALLGMVAWAATGALPQFFAPSFLLLIIVTASCWGREKMLRLATVIVIGGNLALGLAFQARWMPLVHPLEVFGRDFIDAAPKVAPNPPFAAYRALDQMLPPEAKILLVAESRVFGVPRLVIAPSQHDPSPLRHLCEGDEPPGDFAEILGQQGITHLVINDGELTRLGDNYPVAPWKTIRGEGRWRTFIRSLGPPVDERDGVRTYRLSGQPGEARTKKRQAGPPGSSQLSAFSRPSAATRRRAAAVAISIEPMALAAARVNMMTIW